MASGMQSTTACDAWTACSIKKINDTSRTGMYEIREFGDYL
jgi:hypothetical protein